MALAYKTKLLLDHTVGVAVALLFKGAAKLLTLVLRRDHGVPEAPASVAVGKLVGLGSVVYSSTLCRGLKARWPSTRILYVTGRDCAELVRRMSAVDEVLVLDDRTPASILVSGTRLVWTLWRRRPVLYFDLEVYSSLAAILASLSLAMNRYGFYRRSAAFKRNLHTHMVFFNTRRHIEEIYGQMLLAVGGIPGPGLAGALQLRPEDRTECDATLGALGLPSRGLVLVNPNASDLMLERRWPREQWAALLTQALHRYSGRTWVLVGSANERPYVQGIVDLLAPGLRDQVHNLAGRFSIGGFLALLERAGLLITSDSGPLHLAVALGCPTVSLWGPGDPEHYMPRTGVHEVVYTQTYCSPCLYHADFPPCEGDNECMKRTPVDTVLKATDRIMGQVNRNAPRVSGGPQGSAVNMWYLDQRDFSPTILHNTKG